MNEDYRDWLIERILEYIPSGYVRVGKEINCKCPICGDSKKSSLKKRGYLNLENGSFYCHNCGVSFKSGLSFLSRISGEDFSKIRGEFLKIKYSGKVFTGGNGLVPGQTKVKKATDYLFNARSVIRPEWKSPLSEKAKSYLDGRLVTSAPFLKDKLYSYYAKDGNEYILIPWTMNNVESYFQINDFQKVSKTGRKYIFPKNMDKLLFGMDNIDLSWKNIIVTEGVYDSLFIPNCICCGGKYLSELQYEILKKRFPDFKISISFDNDKPGMEAMKSAIEKFGNRYSYLIWFNKNVKQKDINDYVLSKNDPMVFASKDKVERMIFNHVLARMKLW